MKKITNIVLLFFMGFVGMMSAGNPVFSLPTDVQTTVGQTIDVQLAVAADLSPHNVLAYTFAISFNSNLLKITSVQYDAKLEGFTNVANTQQAGKVTLSGAATSKIAGSGALITLTFEALASGNAALNFVQAECVLNEGIPAATYQNGNVTIAPKPKITVTPNSAFMAIDDTQQCYVSGNVTVTEPVTWGVTDPAVGSISSEGVFTATGHGKTKIFAVDNAGLRDTTDNYFEVTAIKLSILDDLEQWQNWSLEIPVKTTDFSSLGVLSGEFSLTYRADALQFVDVNKEGTLLANSSVSVGEVSDGKIKLAFATATALGYETGTLILLRFLVKPGAANSSNLSFSDVVFNENIRAITNNGFFRPKPLPVLTITPATGSLVAGDSLLFTASDGNEPYTWSVSDERVAKIGQDGWLIANEGGTTDVTVTDVVGAVKTVSNIRVADMRIYFSSDTLKRVNDFTYTDCRVDSIPEGRPGVFSFEGEISVTNTNVKIIDIDTEGTFTEGWQKVVVPVTDQRIKFYLAGSNAFRQKGIAFRLKSELKPEFKEYHRSDVRFHNPLVNEGTPAPIFIDGSIEGKIFTEQDRTICLRDNQITLAVPDAEGKTITRWEKRLRRPLPSSEWVTIYNTTATHTDTPDQLGEWEFIAIVDGERIKVANILVETIPDVAGEISGETVFCNVPQTFRYHVQRRPTATEYRWNYTGTGVVLHPNGNILDLEITHDVTPGVLEMKTANHCGESDEKLTLELKPTIQPANFTFDETVSHYKRDTVAFTDTSTGAISWQWSITPAAGTLFVDNTTATSQHPKVQFTQTGTYEIKLKTVNSCRQDSVVKTIEIEEFKNGELTADKAADCLGSTFKLTLTESVGTVEEWQVQPETATEWTKMAVQVSDVINYTPSVAGKFKVRAKLANDRGYSGVVTITAYPTYNETDTKTACGSYTWDGTTYTQSGTYVKTFQTIQGCDSTVTLNLTVKTVDVSVTAAGAELTANATNATYEWLDCEADNEPITGETNAKFTASQNGKYAVQVTQNGCTAVSECLEVTGVGVRNPFAEKIKIYPNPAKDDLTLDLGVRYGEITVKITDMQGQLVEKFHFNDRKIINLTAPYAPGMYLISIISNEREAVMKLVKQ